MRHFWGAIGRASAGLILAAVGLTLNVATTTPVSAQGLVLTCATINQFNFDPVPAGTVAAMRTEVIDLNPGEVITATWGGLTSFIWTMDGTPVPGATGAGGSATYTVATKKFFSASKVVSGGPGFVRFSCAVPPTNPTTPTPPLVGVPFNPFASPANLGQFVDSVTGELVSTKWPGVRTFVLPHVLEKDGCISNTPFSFDTTLFATYTRGAGGEPPPQSDPNVDVFLFDDGVGAQAGGPLQSQPGTEVCAAARFDIGQSTLGRKASITLDALVVQELSDTTTVGVGVKTGFGVIVLSGGGGSMQGGDVNIEGFVVNQIGSGFDLSVFGFAGAGGYTLDAGGAVTPVNTLSAGIGASVSTDIAVDEMTTATPYASALLNGTGRNAFSHPLVGNVPGSQTAGLAGLLGLNISREIPVPELDGELRVNAGVEANLNATSSSAAGGAPLLGDALTFEGSVGFTFVLDNGMAFTLNGSVNGGATSSGASISAGFTAPIESLDAFFAYEEDNPRPLLQALGARFQGDN